ncbi:hypothetical protein [Maricaulis sp. CAU 1757]
MPAALRIPIALASLALLALIAWAMATGNFSAAGAWLTSDPWGLVTLADLYLGFAFIAVIIAAVERKPLAAVFWITPLFVLGNLWTGVWLVVRGGRLWRRLNENLGASR